MADDRNLVPVPCPEDWDRLSPEERGHFCATCQTKVWDISSMTKAEADTLVREQAGDLCVSYRERADGSVIYKPEPVVPAQRLLRRLPAAAGLSLMLAACTPTSGEKDAGPSEDKPAAAEPAAPTPEAQPEPKPEADAPTEAKPEAEATPEDPPAPAELPPERMVKGKWAPPEDEGPEDPKPETTTESKPQTPPERRVKGKPKPEPKPAELL